MKAYIPITIETYIPIVFLAIHSHYNSKSHSHCFFQPYHSECYSDSSYVQTRINVHVQDYTSAPSQLRSRYHIASPQQNMNSHKSKKCQLSIFLQGMEIEIKLTAERDTTLCKMLIKAMDKRRQKITDDRGAYNFVILSLSIM